LIALSADGNTLLEGGPADNRGAGASWVFVQPTAQRSNSHDFNGDGYSNIAWRDPSGNTAIWLMKGTTVLSSGGIGSVPTTWSIVGQCDFDGHGKTDLHWRDTSGDTSIWFMNGTQVSSAAGVGIIPSSWTAVGTGDFKWRRLGRYPLAGWHRQCRGVADERGIGIRVRWAR
jgi:hypothetical protein